MHDKTEQSSEIYNTVTAHPQPLSPPWQRVAFQQTRAGQQDPSYRYIHQPGSNDIKKTENFPKYFYLLSVLVNIESWEAIDAVAVTQGAVGIVTGCAVNVSNNNILVVCKSKY